VVLGVRDRIERRLGAGNKHSLITRDFASFSKNKSCKGIGHAENNLRVLFNFVGRIRMSEVQLDHITPLKGFLEKYPKFKLSTIRWWIHRSQPRNGANGVLPANGFAECFTRKSGRILLIEPRVLEWLTAGEAGEADHG